MEIQKNSFDILRVILVSPKEKLTVINVVTKVNTKTLKDLFNNNGILA